MKGNMKIAVDINWVIRCIMKKVKKLILEGGGSGGVQSVTGTGVDNTDPINPIVDSSGVQSVTGTAVDNTDPANPIVNKFAVKGEYLNNTTAISGGLAVGDIYNLPIQNDNYILAVVKTPVGNLSMTFTNIASTSIGDYNNVALWNSYLRPKGITVDFKSVTVVGNSVTLIGGDGNSLQLSALGLASLEYITLPSLTDLVLQSNQIVTFDPTIALPNGLITLILTGNQIVTFDPTIPLPSGLKILLISNNQIVTFSPTIALPIGLEKLLLNNNQIVTFNLTTELPNLIWLHLYYNQIVTFNLTVALPSLTQLWISSNQLVVFNPTTLSSNSLKNIILVSNKITTTSWNNSTDWISALPNNGIIKAKGNTDNIAGTNTETLLLAKGWTISTSS